MEKNPWEVWQGGATTGYMARVANHCGEFYAGYPNNGDQKKLGGITVQLQHPSKGGGTTQIWAWIPPLLFENLAETMMKASPAVAEKAFLTALLKKAKSHA